jgi:hypothetical protein
MRAGMKYRVAMAFSFLAVFGSLASADPAIRPWIGVHVLVGNTNEADKLIAVIPKLAKMGINALIVEVDYSFQFRSHPEMVQSGCVTWAQAKKIGDLCRANSIRPIPELNCLGHQSWEQNTGELLRVYPQFDETPGKYPGNKGIYCRSWCPLNPDVNHVVFGLVDDLIDAFGADAFHVGMDEVWIIGDDDCPRCKGKNPAELFAKAVNDFHYHLVGQKKVEMMMWGDRLLDAKTIGVGKWESSENNTSAAVDLIPRDIIICDWHYEKQAQYKSIPFLLGKGFRVWPAGWKNIDAAAALMDAALAQKSPRMMGYLSTAWSEVPINRLADFEPTKLALKKFGISQH